LPCFPKITIKIRHRLALSYRREKKFQQSTFKFYLDLSNPWLEKSFTADKISFLACAEPLKKAWYEDLIAKFLEESISITPEHSRKPFTILRGREKSQV